MLHNKADNTARSYGSQGLTISETGHGPAKTRNKKPDPIPLSTHKEEKDEFQSESQSDDAGWLEEVKSAPYTIPELHIDPEQALSGTFSNSQKTVYVQVVFLKIGSIQTVHEQYTADVFIQAKWREPRLDGKQKPDFTRLWNPCLIVHNLKGEAKQEIWYELYRDELGQAWVKERRRVNGTFQERMELKKFPFDIQDIALIIASELSRDCVELVEDIEELSCMRVDLFSDRLEWHMHEFVEFEPMDISSEYSKDTHQCPGIAVSGTVARRPGFFTNKVIFIMTMINLLGFATFAVDVELTFNRLIMMFILALATINVRFLANQNTPAISYLTTLDRYILVNMVFAVAVTIWHAVITRFAYDRELMETLDEGFFIVAVIVFILFQSIYLVSTFVMRLVNDRELNKKQIAFAARAKLLTGDRWKKHHAHGVKIRSGGIFRRRNSIRTALDLFR